MKKVHIYIAIALMSVGAITACSEDFLDKEPQVVIVVENFYKTGNDAILAVNAAYAPLQWEFKDTYFNEWFFGDIVSDDALKGGNGTSDMSDIFQLENFNGTASNESLLQFYRAQYQGIYRCNLAITNIPNITPDDTMSLSIKNRLIAEAKTLRAYYYFRLTRIFNEVPKVTKVPTSSADYYPSRAPRDTIYELIYNDLLESIPNLWLKSEYPLADLGRITKGSAQAILMKAYLYNNKWEDAMAWGDSIISSGEYDLNTNYSNNFTLEGENGTESVFEIQYIEEPTSDYGQGSGYTRGTFNIIMQRTRTGNQGWGFCHPTENLINEYELGDPRKDATISAPDGDVYLGNGYHNKKYALSGYVLAHPTRGPLNYKVIRYADVLLMYAEAACELNQLGPAKLQLEYLRSTRRQGNAAILPEFPYGSYTDDQAGLRAAIRHERRVELAMEGQRFFDLVRWGIAEQVMNAYREGESELVKQYMQPFVAGKHEFFPIPESEINLNPNL